MSVKKTVIPTLTIMIIASQILGCSAVNKSELLAMLNNGDQIEIEVATPLAVDEKGEEQSITWEKLALLETNPDLRSNWDDILKISGTGESKNGVLYVNADGEQDANNTLSVAIKNRTFQDMLSDKATSEELSSAVENNYADLEADNNEKSILMGINAYFNLLPDAEPSYCNPDSTLQRNEFMAMVFRADTPVSELTADSSFATVVGKSDYNIYAQGVTDNSYLNTTDKSLNNQTSNGTITRAEAIYLLVNRYFATELKDADNKATSYADAKDGGDIATSQQFAGKDYGTSYELTYALQNPDKGLPTNLYRALVVAKDKGIITDTDSRWDEGLTKVEAIELLVNALKATPGAYSADQGTISGNEVAEPTTDTTNGNGAGASDNAEVTQDDPVIKTTEAETDSNITVEEYTIEDITPVTMYTTDNCNIRSGPASTYEKVGSLAYGQAVTVVGKAVYNDKVWFKLSPQSDESPELEMVSSTLLSSTKPTKTTTTTPTTTTTTTPVAQTPVATTPTNEIVNPTPGTYVGGAGGGSGSFGGRVGTGDGNGAGGQGIHAE